MDVPQPGPDEPFENLVYITAWKQRLDHIHAGDLDKANALDWANDGLFGLVIRHPDPESVVAMIDMLLEEGTDPENVAMSFLEDALRYRPEIASQAAELCEGHAAWRAAMQHVHLTPAETAAVPEVASYLPAD